MREEKDKLTNYKTCDMTVVKDDTTVNIDAAAAYITLKKTGKTIRSHRQYYSLAEANGWTGI
jgi:hypothetical protein